MAKSDLTQKRLRELLDYDPATGIFTARTTIRRWKAGTQRGTLSRSGANKGRWFVGVESHNYLASRLAWFWMTGRWPRADIDHRDGNPSNDAFANLREATRAENLQNLRNAQKNNQHGFLGVEFDGRYKYAKPWSARICVNWKRINLGRFATPEEAHAAYVAAKRKLHPFGEL